MQRENSEKISYLKEALKIDGMQGDKKVPIEPYEAVRRGGTDEVDTAIRDFQRFLNFFIHFKYNQDIRNNSSLMILQTFFKSRLASFIKAFFKSSAHKLGRGKSPGSRRGESLVEILVAFFVIATTSTASLVVVTQSGNSSRSVENRFMAQHLAEEGLEAFVHLRDTNWIKFHDKNCWDAKPDQEACGENSEGKLLPDSGETFYKIVLEQNDMRWSIEKVSQELNLMKKLDMTPQKPYYEPYGLYEIKDDPVKKGMLMGFSGGKPPGADNPKFYRMLKLKILDSKKGVEARVKVQWIVTGEVREISLGKIFTNY